MVFDKIDLEDIVPAGYNPRKISDDELEKLSNSIDNFGLVDPIIINLNNNKIIGGHQRYDVLSNNNVKELYIIKLGDVGWCFTDTDLKIKSAEHEKALNIALNKISGEWDNKKLNELLVDLDSNNFDVELTGFNNEHFMSLNIDYCGDLEKIYDDFKFNEKNVVDENIINSNNNIVDENKINDVDYDELDVSNGELNKNIIKPDYDIETNLKNEITVVCVDEDDMVEKFNKLKDMGLNCKMLVN